MHNVIRGWVYVEIILLMKCKFFLSAWSYRVWKCLHLYDYRNGAASSKSWFAFAYDHESRMKHMAANSAKVLCELINVYNSMCVVYLV